MSLIEHLLREAVEACEKVVADSKEKPFHESRGNADEAIKVCESIVARAKTEFLSVKATTNPPRKWKCSICDKQYSGSKYLKLEIDELEKNVCLICVLDSLRPRLELTDSAFGDIISIVEETSQRETLHYCGALVHIVVSQIYRRN